ncbi:50S ribosomal protein L10 [Planctomycetales bacterium 10988]|nr:50S ribosomal protein L10 [Planctomycetales bacterium 10988]
MSKYVKGLIIDHFRDRLQDVENALVVNVSGIDANVNNELRHRLREKQIELLVIKNSLARKAFKETPLFPSVDGLTGPSALVWGGEDIVSVAKEITKIAEDDHFKPFEIRGGAMDGAALSAEMVVAVSKWPSRQEVLSTIVGQLLSPGMNLSGALLGPGKLLASQIKKISEGEDGEPVAE